MMTRVCKRAAGFQSHPQDIQRGSLKRSSVREEIMLNNLPTAHMLGSVHESLSPAVLSLEKWGLPVDMTTCAMTDYGTSKGQHCRFCSESSQLKYKTHRYSPFRGEDRPITVPCDVLFNLDQHWTYCTPPFKTNTFYTHTFMFTLCALCQILMMMT
ncbi:hypothetical protein AAFF_G00019300 [Aldrovandia affinis]|uniref:Uncharacterized protein n=1 Tax=Aldrovandia affinis TaxID=143900 RepID=A0AAD7S5J7_9TELE|nr:hypothetical protein AAFF_G00019300 [Aldrovandia affinis]